MILRYRWLAGLFLGLAVMALADPLKLPVWLVGQTTMRPPLSSSPRWHYALLDGLNRYDVMMVIPRLF